MNIRQRAIDLYTPPFRFDYGYIFDSKGEMFCDDKLPQLEQEDSTIRIRGWGRIGYMEEPEKLQNEVGKLIAELLTEHWPT